METLDVLSKCWSYHPLQIGELLILNLNVLFLEMGQML